MTIKELIKELKKHPQNNTIIMDIYFKDGNNIDTDNFSIYSNDENKTYLQTKDLNNS